MPMDLLENFEINNAVELEYRTFWECVQFSNGWQNGRHFVLFTHGLDYWLLASLNHFIDKGNLLCSYLKKWGIEGNVVFHKESEDQYYIGLPARDETFGTLVKIIEPIVNQIPDMIYKLNDQCKPRNDWGKVF